MSKKAKSKTAVKSNPANSTLMYKAKKQFEAGVRADTTAALKKPATIKELAKRMHVEVRKANNLVRWLVWQGYVTRA